MTFKIIICFATVGFLLANLVMRSSCQTYNFCLEKLHLNVVLLFVIHLDLIERSRTDKALDL